MKIEQAIERLTEIRNRYEKNIKILEENNAILKNTNFYEVLGERRADFEAIDTVLKTLDTLQTENEAKDEMIYDLNAMY